MFVASARYRSRLFHESVVANNVFAAFRGPCLNGSEVLATFFKSDPCRSQCLNGSEIIDHLHIPWRGPRLEGVISARLGAA